MDIQARYQPNEYLMHLDPSLLHNYLIKLKVNYIAIEVVGNSSTEVLIPILCNEAGIATVEYKVSILVFPI